MPVRKPFKDEDALVKWSLGSLAQHGISPAMVEKLRERASDSSFSFTKEIVGQRRMATSVLLAEGLSNEQIATVLKSSKQTVAADREHCRTLWRDSVLQTADTWRAKLLEEQEAIKKKALNAFDKSRTKKITRIGGKAGEDFSSVQEEETAGDAAFLNVAKGCIVEQAKMLGLYDTKVATAEETGYKKFLKDMASEVQKLKHAEQSAEDRAKAVATTALAEYDEEGEPTGNSRPMLSASDED